MAKMVGIMLYDCADDENGRAFMRNVRKHSVKYVLFS